MATFAFKAFTLALKTIAKPLSSRVEAYAMGHPKIRAQAIAFAQRLHRIEVAVTRGAEGKTSKVFVGDMQEEQALAQASKFISEGFVFVVGMGVLAWEVGRNRLKDLEKKAKEEAFKKAVDDEMEADKREMRAQIAGQNQMIAELLLRLGSIENDVGELKAAIQQRPEEQSAPKQRGLLW